MASGQRLFQFTMQDNIYVGSNPATPDVRNGHPCLDFDSSTAETAMFADVLVDHYAGGGITVALAFTVDTATSGDAVWGVSFERIDDEGLDIDSDSFGSEKTVTAAAPSTSGQMQYCTISFADGSEIDSLAVRELYRLKVRRVSSDGGDTINSNDCELHAVFAFET